MCGIAQEGEKAMQEKGIFIEEELTEEMLKELSNGKGDDEDE